MALIACQTDWVQVTNLICNSATVVGLAWIAGRQQAVKARLEERDG